MAAGGKGLGAGGRVRGRQVRAVAVTLVAALVVSACQWAQVGFGPEHRRHNTLETELTIDNVASLTPVWSADTPGAATEPIVADDRVYVTRAISSATGGVWVRSLSTADGTTVWERQIGSGQLTFPTPIANARFRDQVSAGFSAISSTRDCVSVTADLNAATGGRPIIHNGLMSGPAVTAGSVMIRTSGRTTVSGPCQNDPTLIRATDLTTGDQLWTATATDSGRSASDAPAIADGRVYVTDGPRLHAYALGGCGAATCRPLWTTTLASPAEGAWAPVAGENGHVFVIVANDDNDTDSTELISVNAQTGTVRWRTDLNAPNPFIGTPPWIAAAGDTIYVTTPGSLPGTNLLRAFPANGCGATTCAPRWTAVLDDRPSAPVVAGGVVYVGTNGHVAAYDATGCGTTTCTPITTIPTPGQATRLSVAQGTLYVTGGDTVTAYAPTPP
jgi:outer membrane protein assembly factor BamB